MCLHLVCLSLSLYYPTCVVQICRFLERWQGTRGGVAASGGEEEKGKNFITIEKGKSTMKNCVSTRKIENRTDYNITRTKTQDTLRGTFH